MPIGAYLAAWSANKDGAVTTSSARHARPAAGGYAGRRACDHDLLAFLQAVRDLDELIVLHAGLDHARRRLGRVGGDVDHLVAALAPYGAQRDDQHVVLFVDGDCR